MSNPVHGIGEHLAAKTSVANPYIIHSYLGSFCAASTLEVMNEIVVDDDD